MILLYTFTIIFLFLSLFDFIEKNKKLLILLNSVLIGFNLFLIYYIGYIK